MPARFTESVVEEAAPSSLLCCEADGRLGRPRRVAELLSARHAFPGQHLAALPAVEKPWRIATAGASSADCRDLND